MTKIQTMALDAIAEADCRWWCRRIGIAYESIAATWFFASWSETRGMRAQRTLRERKYQSRFNDKRKP